MYSLVRRRKYRDDFDFVLRYLNLYKRTRFLNSRKKSGYGFIHFWISVFTSSKPRHQLKTTSVCIAWQMKTNLINVWIYLWFLKDLWFPYIVLSWNAADTDNALTFFLVQARHFTPPPPPVCNSIQEIWHWRKFSLACLYNTESWWCWLCRVAEILVHKLCFRNCFLLYLSGLSLYLSLTGIL